jgi:outer membrane lipase/esterase
MLKRSLLKIAIPLLLVFVSWAQADTSFSRLYVFGDSLSDTGNFGTFVGGLPFPFYMNRISNGPVAVERLAELLGLTANASLHVLMFNAGTNYAVAGANAIGKGPEDLSNQILGFQGNHGFVAPADALYVMFIGGNDVRSARSVASFKQAKLMVQAAANEVRQAIETLAQAGAHTFLLVNAQNVGAIPETRLIADAINDPKLVKRTRKLSELYRKELHKIAEDLGDDDEYNIGDENELNIVEFDLFKFFNKLLKKADKLGFTNATDPCFSPQTVSFHPDCNSGANFDQFIFFDEIHPTARAHALVGEALFEALQDDDAAAQHNWPEAIAIPTGFEAEGIELGKGHEFFLGGFSFSSAFGGAPKVSAFAGAIYKGNLRTGEGAILVPSTGKPVTGLSYDPRTDYLYAATGDVDLAGGSFTDQGVIVYDASSGDVIMKIGFGDGIALNDVLVTRTGVYVTDSLNPDLYKLPLEKGGRLPSNPVYEAIFMPGFEMVDGFNANGLVGKFDGRQLVIVNTSTGVLYRVDTARGEAAPLEIEGAEQLFPDGDGLYLDGRTLYIMQNFSDKIAVVQLSGDLSGGKFIRNIPGEGEINPLKVATSIIGFGNSLYAINTNFLDPLGPIFGDPAKVQAKVVKLKKLEKSKKSKKSKKPKKSKK